MLKFKKNIDDRKELAQMISGLTGQRSVYTRAPLYAYQIGPYMVDREGDLYVAEADVDWEVLNLLIEDGYILPMGGAAEHEAAVIVETVYNSVEESADYDNESVSEASIGTVNETADEAPEVTNAEPEQETTEEVIALVEEEADINDSGAAEANSDLDTIDEPDSLTDEVFTEAETVAEVEAPDEDEASTGVDSTDDSTVDAKPVEFNFTLPITGHTGTSLRNLVYLIYSRAPMLNKVTGANFRVDKALVAFLRDDTCTYTVDAFRKKLADYEAEHGIGVEGLVIGEDAVTFCGFVGEADHDHMTAYGQLAMMMNKMAIKQKRIQAKSVSTENEKYSFRIWLLRLGMNGDEFKHIRRLLMENLEGHTAFRTPEEAERAKRKAQQKRAELKAAKEAAEADEAKVSVDTDTAAEA